jgi:hypothetical protein
MKYFTMFSSRLDVCMSLLAAIYVVMPIDNEELPICNLFPSFWPHICVKYDTKSLLHWGVWHVHKVVLGIMHSLFFVFLDRPIFWSSLHLFNGDCVLHVHLEYKALLLLCPELLIHCFGLKVVCFSTQLEIKWNLFDSGCCTHLSSSWILHLLWLRQYYSRLLSLAA